MAVLYLGCTALIWAGIICFNLPDTYAMQIVDVTPSGHVIAEIYPPQPGFYSNFVHFTPEDIQVDGQTDVSVQEVHRGKNMYCRFQSTFSSEGCVPLHPVGGHLVIFRSLPLSHSSIQAKTWNCSYHIQSEYSAALFRECTLILNRIYGDYQNFPIGYRRYHLDIFNAGKHSIHANGSLGEYHTVQNSDFYPEFHVQTSLDIESAHHLGYTIELIPTQTLPVSELEEMTPVFSLKEGFISMGPSHHPIALTDEIYLCTKN